MPLNELKFRVKADQINQEQRGFRIVLESAFDASLGMHIQCRGGTMRLSECRFDENGRLIIASNLHCVIEEVIVWKEAFAMVHTIEGGNDFEFHE